MAVYKVIQDIEAEDKFLGPLTLKQFIFAAITVLCFYLGFLFVTKDLWFLTIPLLPIIGIGGFLAFPWGRDQPTEVWLLAKLRFYFKPRQRVWDQSGMQELVTITAPKNNNYQYTNNLSQTEIHSRLRALADTIDSRGWAVKNSNVTLPAGTAANVLDEPSDRLVAASSLPQDVPITDVLASDDMLDEANNPVAQQLDQMMASSAEKHREAALEKMNDIRAGGGTDNALPAANDWFVNKSDPTGMGSMLGGYDDPNAPLSAEEQALLDKLHHDQAIAEATPIHGHMKVIQPLSKQKGKGRAKPPKAAAKAPANSAPKPAAKPAPVAAAQPLPPPPPPPANPVPDPAILELAINNDRDVASLAREANALHKQPDEVVIRLH